MLEARQQAILFLNRRGTATYVFCRDCGSSPRLPATATCRSPSTPPQAALICHYCGYQRPCLPPARPAAATRSASSAPAPNGWKRRSRRVFPEARTLRWDAETTRQKGAHEIILAHFANHRADMLIGTQMLAKGLDLPLVTLVGVVLADVGLNLPDYRAGERTFQVLTQVAGRAGRSPLGGRVILQTFQPDHYVIQAAAGHDYEAFYRAGDRPPARDWATRLSTGWCGWNTGTRSRSGPQRAAQEMAGAGARLAGGRGPAGHPADRARPLLFQPACTGCTAGRSSCAGRTRPPCCAGGPSANGGWR